jgi:tetratricopeptide (TPR) repeat protein
MKKYGVILIVLFFISCQQHYTRNEVILRAEKVLDAAPDSAYKLLSSFAHPEKLPEADYAAWCLQYTHASYKLQKKFTSDSIIRISVNYYKNSKLKKQSGTAWYLLGCVLELLQKDTVAMEAYKEAENVLAQTNENKLKGLVQFSLGYICMQDEMYSNSLNYFRNSLEFFNQSGDKKYKAYAYRDMSIMYYQLNSPLDSILYYSDKALKLSKETGDSTNYYYILANQGELLYDMDYARSKEFLLKGFNFFPMQRYYYGSYLAYIYSKLNKTDSANYYLKISMTGTDNSPYKIIGLHAAALIAQNRSDYKKAYYYLEKSYILRDSIFQQNMTSQLHIIDKQYDLTQKEIENKALKIANQTKIIWIALLAVGFLIILVLFLLISNRSKQKQADDEMEKQRLKFSNETTEIQNLQKRELLLAKVQNKIENTLAFNRLTKGLMTQGKKEQFLEEITKQSTLSEKDWPDFIKEVDNLLESRIAKLKKKFTELTNTDCVVIALICLKINISNSCLLLNMSKNTIYKRRKTIKRRLELDADTDLEKWIVAYMSSDL